MNASSAPSYVQVGRLTVPEAAVRLALDLEARGLRLELDGDGLLVGPIDRLTDEDRNGIRRWREHLKAIVAHCGRETVQ